MGGRAGVGSNTCQTCPVRAQSLVCRAADADASAFLRYLHRFIYQPRQVVFYEGHPCLGIYVLCAGKVKLTASSSRGHRRIVGIVGPGELIEYSGFCGSVAHEATCETLESSRLCLIDREGYLEVLKRNPALAIELLQLVSGRAWFAATNGEPAPFCKTTERLAALLLHLGQRFGHRASDGITLDIRLTREELGELIGAAPETVIRLLSHFKRERLVNTNGSEITLLKPERLNKIAKIAGSLQ